MRARFFSSVFDTGIIEVLAALCTVDELLRAISVVTNNLFFCPFVDFQTEHG